MKPLLILIAFIFFNLGCQTTGGPILGLEPSKERKELYQRSLQSAWEQFEAGQFLAAGALFKEFQKKYPQTIYSAEAFFGEARSLEMAEDIKSALVMYQELSRGRLSSEPQWAAQALYFQAGIYEILGNDTQMLASLLDANKRADKLPVELREAALPARLATALLKVGDVHAAKEKMKEARIGLKKLQAQKYSADQLAKIYYEMSALATDQLSVENFQLNLDGLGLVQEFLLRSIEMEQMPWSEKALKRYQGHLGHFWNFAMDPPVSRALDVAAQKRSKAELTVRWVGLISEKIVLLRQLMREEKETRGPQERGLSEFLAHLDRQVNQVLLQPQELHPLTDEGRLGPGSREGLAPAGPPTGAGDPNLKTESEK